MAEAAASPDAARPPARETPAQRTRRWALFIGLTIAVLVLDQASKLWVDASFELASRSIPAGQAGGPTEVVADLVRIAKVYNDGAIFGLFDAIAPLMAVLTIAVVVGIVWFEWRHGAGGGTLVTIGLALLLGGAIGNLIDRVRIGHVIDFVDVGLGSFRWYAWNVADAAVFLGIVCLFAAALLSERTARGRRDAARPG